MPTERKTKQPGFLVKTEAFVPTAIADTGALMKVQKLVDDFGRALGEIEAQGFTPVITPTRR